MEKTYKITLPKGVSVNEIETNVEDGVLSVSVEMGRFDYAERNVLLSMRVIENHVNGIEFGVEGDDNVELKHD